MDARVLVDLPEFSYMNVMLTTNEKECLAGGRIGLKLAFKWAIGWIWTGEQTGKYA